MLLYIEFHSKVGRVQPWLLGLKLPSLTVVIPRPVWVNTASSVKAASISSSNPPVPRPLYRFVTNASDNGPSPHVVSAPICPSGFRSRKSWLQDTMNTTGRESIMDRYFNLRFI